MLESDEVSAANKVDLALDCVLEYALEKQGRKKTKESIGTLARMSNESGIIEPNVSEIFQRLASLRNKADHYVKDKEIRLSKDEAYIEVHLGRIGIGYILRRVE